MDMTKHPRFIVEDVKVVGSYTELTCDFCSKPYKFKLDVFARGIIDETGYANDIYVCEKHVPKVGDRY